MTPELEDFEAHLAQVERASPHTRRAYLSDLRQLAAFLREREISLDAATRDDLRAFLGSRFGSNSSATLARKQASVRAFYEHRVRMGHIADSPARRLMFPKRRTFPQRPHGNFEIGRDLLGDTGVRCGQHIVRKLQCAT